MIKRYDFTVRTFKYILKSLSQKRPIFHSEADFQHALAWKIHQKFNKIDIRLERRFTVNELGEIYVDILLKICDATIAIETKYTTKKLEIKLNGEEFVLKDHSALDIRRYDFLLDMYRLEKLKSAGEVVKGYAVFLTNVPGYWKEPRRKNTNDKDFRIHQGRKIKANETLQWASNTSKGTKRGRERPLRFEKEYLFEWELYSEGEIKGTHYEFKYLLVEV